MFLRMHSYYDVLSNAQSLKAAKGIRFPEVMWQWQCLLLHVQSREPSHVFQRKPSRTSGPHDMVMCS